MEGIPSLDYFWERESMRLIKDCIAEDIRLGRDFAGRTYASEVNFVFHSIEEGYSVARLSVSEDGPESWLKEPRTKDIPVFHFYRN